MFEADITKVVEEMAVRIRETEEDFILDTIFPYCQETLQRKINKAELKQIILRGSRPKGKWIHWTDDYKDYCTCSECGYGEEGEVLLKDKTPYCPNCGADMRGGEDENSN